MKRILLMAAVALLGAGLAFAALTQADLTPTAIMAAMQQKPAGEKAAFAAEVLAALGAQPTDGEAKTQSLTQGARALVAGAGAQTVAIIAEVFNSTPMENLQAVADLLSADFNQKANGFTDAQFDRLASNIVKSGSSYIEASGTDSPAVRMAILAAAFAKSSTDIERTQKAVIAALPASVQAAAETYVAASVKNDRETLAAATGVDEMEATPANPDANNVVAATTPAEGATDAATATAAGAAAAGETAANDAATAGADAAAGATAAAGETAGAADAAAAGAAGAVAANGADAAAAGETAGATAATTPAAGETAGADAATAATAAGATAAVAAADTTNPEDRPELQPTPPSAVTAGGEQAVGGEEATTEREVHVPLLGRYATDHLGMTLDHMANTVYNWEVMDPREAHLDPPVPTIIGAGDMTQAAQFGTDLAINNPATGNGIERPTTQPETIARPSDPYAGQDTGAGTTNSGATTKSSARSIRTYRRALYRR